MRSARSHRTTLKDMLRGVLAAMCVASGGAQATTAAYSEVLDIVERGGEWERYDFARAALAAMISEHEAALARAGEFPGNVRDSTRRWQAAARPYLQSLYAALDTLEVSDGVDVVVVPGVSVQILVGPHNVLVSAVDIRRPGWLEDAIVREFCGLHDCRSAVFDLGGRWTFDGGSGPGFATDIGVRCLFAGAKGRGPKERACRELGSGLVELLRRLRAAQAAGIELEPDVFAVEREGPATLSLALNRGGDWLMIDHPIVSRLPLVLEMALPWVEDRLAGGTTELVIPRAELLLDAVL